MLSEELVSAVLPVAQFRGLSLAAADPVRQAAFWGVPLSGTVEEQGRGSFQIVSGSHRPANEILRLRHVGTPPPDGARVHLDIRLPGAEPVELLDAGASLVSRPGPDPWYVLADPEGNQFCAFPAVDDRPTGIFELVVKCHDAHRLARWWSAVLGGTVETEGEAAAVTGAPDFPWDFMVFDPVPEPKEVPNRMRWHLTLRDRDVSALLEAGAVVVDRPPAGGDTWVLADPEGNEFFAAVSGPAS